MIFLAAFLGCLVALVVYFAGRDVVSSIIWKLRYGKGVDTEIGTPTTPAFFQQLNADHELRLVILDLTSEPNPELEAKILEKARAWRLLVPEDVAQRMRDFNPYGTTTVLVPKQG